MGRVRRLLWEVQRIILIGYLGLGVWHLLGSEIETALNGGSWLGMGCIWCGSEEAQVRVEQLGDGSYQASLCGHFTIQVDGEPSLRLRMLLIFLGLLQTPNDERKSRRTRDGRMPFVRQEQMASWFGVKQECISRWMKYWLAGDWANLLSLKTAEVLTPELVERIVEVCASFPRWKSEQVYQHLRQQGVKVSREQVEQAAEQSGWKRLRETLLERYEIEAGLRLRDEWLVAQLLAQVQRLLGLVEAQGVLPAEEQLNLSDLQALTEEALPDPQIPLPTQPWMQQAAQVVFGKWDEATQEAIRCCYCHSTAVSPKSKKPRWKKYYDAEGHLQQVAVYRYYCHNPGCAHKSFTHYPTGLLPYSRYPLRVHVLALQMYAWGYSTYRRTAEGLGLYSMTVWRWVSAWGCDLLPMAAMFGIVRSSGAVGVDEKYVLVPKNNKPASKMRRWMYVYFAVDAWTYDLLHIAIYPNNDQDSAKAFLLALRTKGFHPKVIVTDLRQDYAPLIAQVFPAAVHHECIFHALQNVQRHVKEVYGSNYAELFPEAELLKKLIYNIFDTPSPGEAERRFHEVLSLQPAYLEATPASIAIFAFLELHWPRLVNAIGSTLIPTTNNSTELVIRRFDQHYQNFCGFESIETAQLYLAVFEKLYRFTPFSQDAQPRIRGKSPLQLSGYDISHIPMSTLCSGLSVDWPTEVNLVPN
jgi:transposase-like protein